MKKRPADASPTRTLTSAVASGDSEALARLYRAWFDRLFTAAQRLTGRDESFCLDVVHDAMLRVISSLRPVETEAALGAWLIRVVRSCAYDRLRREAVRARREARAARHTENREEADDLAEQLRWLETRLAELRSEQSELFTMRYRFGWTLGKIGRAAGLKTGAVDGRLHRIMDGLREQARETHHE